MRIRRAEPSDAPGIQALASGQEAVLEARYGPGITTRFREVM